MTKPNCFECKHRRSVPGSAHSACKHPNTKIIDDSPQNALLELVVMMGAPVIIDVGLNVTGHTWGIENGWFNHPFNFDPCWLLTCDGFEAKDD